MDHERVLARVVDWAQRNDNVRAVVLTGSVARDDGARDELSDLDVELYVREPSQLLDHDDWYRQFGDVLVVEALSNQGWNPTRLIYLVDGKIDFTINDIADVRASSTYARPFRVLLDKDAIAQALPLPTPSDAAPPSPDDFAVCVNWFYAAAIMGAKCLARNEPWMAKVRDWDAKVQLLKMIEWDHKARYGWDYDTWHNGAHMHGWMDADVVTRLQECWADFAIVHGRSTLAASVRLFDELSSRTAPRALGFEPFDGAAVHAEVARILAYADSQ